MHKMCEQILALILSTAMAVSIIPMHNVRAAEQTKEEASASDEMQYERIDIASPEQFADFASKCFIDSWSKDKYVSLKTDIDLAGTEINSIPVFNGIFDGVGHTISGFDCQGDGYVVGLFRYVEREGVIQNLTLRVILLRRMNRNVLAVLQELTMVQLKTVRFKELLADEIPWVGLPVSMSVQESLRGVL